MENDGERLAQFLEENSISVLQVSEKLNMSKSSIYNFLNSEKIDLRSAIMLATVLDLNLSFFGIDESKLLLRKVQQNDIISYAFLKKNKGKDYTDFLLDYFTSLRNVIQKAEKSIIVLDYLGNNFQNEKKQAEEVSYTRFHYLYKQYLTEITRAIRRRTEQDKDFTYRRILQIPFGHTSSKSIDRAHADDEELGLKEDAIDYLYSSTIAQHRYLSLGVKYLNYSLEVIKVPLRNYSFMIIDNETLVSEYDKPNSAGEIYADLLYVQKGHLADVMIDTYTDQLKRIDEKGNIYELKVDECKTIIEKKLKLLQKREAEKVSNTWKEAQKLMLQLGESDESIEVSSDLDTLLNKVQVLKGKNSPSTRYKRKLEIIDYNQTQLEEYLLDI